jgi:hypothetical protein
VAADAVAADAVVADVKASPPASAAEAANAASVRRAVSSRIRDAPLPVVPRAVSRVSGAEMAAPRGMGNGGAPIDTELHPVRWNGPDGTLKRTGSEAASRSAGQFPGLGDSQYGKAEVRLVHATRDGDRHATPAAGDTAAAGEGGDLITGIADAARFLGYDKLDSFRRARTRNPIPGETRTSDGRPAWTLRALRNWHAQRKIAGNRAPTRDAAQHPDPAADLRDR